MSKEKQINYKEYARQMRENAVRDSADNVICSAELWEELASTIERLAECFNHSEWISVEDRLPDEQGHFLIVDKEEQMNTAFYTPRFGWFSHFRIKNITHWMPLPEAPKMKDGAE